MVCRDKDEYNAYMREYMRRWYIKRKLDAVAYKGGECVRCGYDKCPAAMVFHHRDPGEKEVDWKRLRRWSWDKVTAELDKCDLLCANCHHEEHWDTNITDEAIGWLKKHKRPSASYEKSGKCPVCQRAFTRDNNSRHKIYCSAECGHLSQERANYPSDKEFIAVIDKIGRVKAGKRFGVSDRAIGKRYKRIKARL